MSEPTLQQTFQRGVQAARRGRNEAAQRLLKEVVAADPQHEQAWLWLARVTEDPAAKTEYLQRVTALNPDNKWAADQLAALASGAPADASAPTVPPPPPSAPKIKIVELKCVKCAGAVSVHDGAGVKTVVCRYCGSVLDLSGEQQAILSKVKKNARPRKPIKPGAKATFDGKTYEVYGWLQYRGSGDGETWTWDEWLLVAEDNQSRWLSYDPEAGFVLQERIETYEPFDPRKDSSFKTPKGRARVQERATAKITALAGELTWRASVGDKISYLEARTNSLLFSVEYTDRELEIHVGPSIPEIEVWRAFGRKKEIERLEKRNVKIAQYDQLGKVAFWFGLLAGLLALFGIVSGNEVFTESVQLRPGQQTTHVVGPVEIDRPNRVHRITLRAHSLNTNAWALVSAWALDEKKTKFYLFGASFWDEVGHDSDGPWHESDLKGTHLFKPATAGAYMLEITLEESEPATMPIDVTVRVEEGVWMIHYFIGLGVLCALLWFFLRKRRA